GRCFLALGPEHGHVVGEPGDLDLGRTMAEAARAAVLQPDGRAADQLAVGDHRLELALGLGVARDVRDAQAQQLLAAVAKQLAGGQIGSDVAHLVVGDQDRNRGVLHRLAEETALHEGLRRLHAGESSAHHYDRLVARPEWAPDVLALFVELAALPSPPGEERLVADRVLDYLKALGLDADEDDAGAEVGSTMGNIYCRLEGSGEGQPVFLCAHLDTVPPEAAIEPVVGEDEIVRNGAGTILGADDKSAVAAMLEATARLVDERREHAGVELLFTPKEEVGLLGAAAFDASRFAAKVGYVYDHAGPPGEIILGAPHQQKLDVRFHGRAAHAGMYPEEGRSAIAAAAHAIADLRLGRLDDETSAN